MLVQVSDWSPTPGDAAATFLAGELEQVGADAGYVGVLDIDKRTVEVSRVTRYSEKPVRLTFPADAPYPLVQALRDMHPLFIGSNEALACDHPGLTRVVEQDHACATLPLLGGGGNILGAVNLAFEDPHDFSDLERSEIQAIAERCAAALADALGTPV